MNGGEGLRGVTSTGSTGAGRMAGRLDAPFARLVRGEWVLNGATAPRRAVRPNRWPRSASPPRSRPRRSRNGAGVPEATPFPALPARIAEMERLGLPAAPVLDAASRVVNPTGAVRCHDVDRRYGCACASRASAGARTVVLGGLGAAFALYVASVLVRAFGSAGIVAPVVAAWLPVLAALMLGTAILLRTEDG